LIFALKFIYLYGLNNNGLLGFLKAPLDATAMALAIPPPTAPAKTAQPQGTAPPGKYSLNSQ